MAQRPNRYPRFAYDPPGGAIIEPTAGVQQAGFATGDRPPAQWLNFLLNLMGGWIDYVRGPRLGDWQRYAAYASAWGTTGFAAPLRVVTCGADTQTDPGTVPVTRVVAVGQDAGANLLVQSSYNGVAWTDVTANILTGTLDLPRFVGVLASKWFLLTNVRVMYTPRDDGSATAIVAGGPDWTTATLPAGLTEPKALAASSNTDLGLAYDITGPVARFAFSVDGGSTFAAAGVTGGPPTGAARDIAWTGTYYVAITTTGEVWRSTGPGANFANSATIATSNYWALAVGANGRLVAYELRQTTTRVRVSDDHGATWTSATIPSEVQNVTRLAWVDDAWVASALDAPYVWQSNDLATWNPCVLPQPVTPDDAWDYCYVDGAVLAVTVAAAYLSGRAADAGPGPADGLTAPAPLSDAAYLRGVVLDASGATDGEAYVYDATSDSWLLDGAVRARVTTLDATPTPVASIKPDDGTCVSLWVEVDGRENSGSQGASYIRRATYRRAGGTVTLVGSVQTIGSDAEDNAAWDVGLSVSGTDVVVSVTGAALTTIDWTCRIHRGPTAP